MSCLFDQIVVGGKWSPMIRRLICVCLVDLQAEWQTEYEE